MLNQLFSIPLLNIHGETKSMGDFMAKAILVVNTASECGFTPQYQELEQLWQRYSAQGLMVLGFPCNQFGQQEKGSNQEIEAFCQLNYGVSFPMFAKVEVNGSDAHPLFRYLKSQAPGLLGHQAIKWNFTKFLISDEGRRVERFAPVTKPLTLEDKIVRILTVSPTD
ncbi:glutathione peroxidase [Budviciaceae bacterium CWB-B4]|uniref:Glutathione peroxidase n=1 Tax=Limnobaculum xujianqingii TaxID=2738837 RepID=A0A9D7AJ01_9GAMM|nr:glutathione peroxidase [Limnobaculum xujianqingii]MBK5074065.1 glutathione peroxidase [Limnobaculum xujianqingii]MBK5177041.1 glutathione peroxidase [Limnobaculum xujianqingii]